MVILYIATDTSWGGSSVALYNIVSELKDRHKIYVLLPDCSGRFGRELSKLGVETCQFPFRLSCWPKIKTPFDVVKYPKRLVKALYLYYSAPKKFGVLLDRINPDIVHCNVGPINISLKECIKRNIPHVWHLREYQDVDFHMWVIPCRSYYERMYLHKCTHNIAITRGVFDHWKLDPQKDCVIYDGVINTKKGADIEPVTREKYFLFVGRIQKTKGVEEVYEAFKVFHAKHSEYQLLYAGGWANNECYANSFRNRIMKDGMSEHVVMLGQRTDVYELMRKAQALLVLSYFEGFGFITAEAMYNECIVIGNNTAGTKEQFDNGVNKTGQEIGLRTNNYIEAAEAMEYVISNNMDEMRQRAKAVVTDMYSTEVCANSIESFYHRIMNNN